MNPSNVITLGMNQAVRVLLSANPSCVAAVPLGSLIESEVGQIFEVII